MTMSMNYIPELIAMAILFLVLIYYTKGLRIKSVRNTWFMLSVISAIAYCMSNVIGIIAIDNAYRIPRLLAYFANDVFFLASPFMVILIGIYLYNIIREEADMPGTSSLLYISAGGYYLITVAMVVANHFTPVLYYFNDEDVYVRAAYNSVPIVLVLLYAVILTVMLRRYFRYVTKSSRQTLFMAVAVAFVVSGVQYAFKNIQLQGTGFMMCVLIIYFVYQNKSFEIDYNIGCLNRETLFVDLKRRYVHKPPQAFALVKITNQLAINGRFGWRTGNEFLRLMASFLFELCGKDSVYLVTGTEFMFAIYDTDVDGIMKKAIDRFDADWNCGNALSNVDANFSLCTDNTLFVDPSLVRVLEYGAVVIHNTDERFVKCDRALAEKLKREIEIVNKVERAIEEKTYSFTYQPVYNIQESPEKIFTVFCEAVVNDEKLGLLDAASISQIADSASIQQELNHLAFESACRLQTQLEQTRLNYVYVVAKFGLAELRSATGMQRLEDAMRRSGADFRKIVVQVEPYLEEFETSYLLDTITRLRALGLRTAVLDLDMSFLKSEVMCSPDYVVFSGAAFNKSERKTNEIVAYRALSVMLRSNDIETVLCKIDNRHALEAIRDNTINYAIGDGLCKRLSLDGLIAEMDDNRALTCSDAWEDYGAKTVINTSFKF